MKAVQPQGYTRVGVNEGPYMFFALDGYGARFPVVYRIILDGQISEYLVH